MNTINEENIEKAVNWWANKIGNPGIQNNGAYDTTNAIVCMYATILAHNYVPDEFKLIRFKNKLTELIKIANPYQLVVDYHPDSILAEAAKYAGINEAVFPWKTVMVFDNDCVRVRDGYEKSFKTI